MAFLIDWLLAWALLFAFVQLSGRDDLNNMFKGVATRTWHSESASLKLALDTGSFLPPFHVTFETCSEVGVVDPNIIDYYAPFEVVSAKACWPRILGLPRDGSMEAKLKDPATGSVTTDSTPIHSNDPFIANQDCVALALFIGLSALCCGLWGATPGKVIAGLRLQGASLRVTFQRELLRCLPWVCSVGPLYLGNRLFQRGIVSDATVGLIINVMLGMGGLAILILWTLPLIRWRGAMTYDWVAGTAVVRAARPVAGI